MLIEFVQLIGMLNYHQDGLRYRNAQYQHDSIHVIDVR